MLAHKIFDILKDISSMPQEEFPATLAPIFDRLKHKISKGEKLTFLLPAFPAKSPSPHKTSGNLPDMGEVLALETLNEMCRKISTLYPVGAEVIICSDGRAFGDVVKVSDRDIDAYSQGIEDIITEFSFEHIKTLSLDDLYPGKQADELRSILLQDWSRSLEEIKDLVKQDSDYRKLFNGMHRFLQEDLSILSPELVKSQVHKISKEATYELMRRSEAWSKVLAERFPQTLRLSIHPYPLHHEKFGVKLVKSSQKWGTPWHNVTVKTSRGFELMHLIEVKKLNGVMKQHKERYVYFEI